MSFGRPRRKRLFDPAGSGIAQERLPGRARASLGLAQSEARGLGYNYVGTEHLVLGLIDVADGVAPGVPNSYALDRSAVLAAITAPAVGAVPNRVRSRDAESVASRGRRRVAKGPDQ